MTDLNDVVPLLLARLERAGTTVLDGFGEGDPTPAGQYLVVYTDGPRLRAGRLVADFRRQILGFRVVCAGRHPGEARDGASWALSRLVRWEPVPGDPTVGLVAPVPDGAPILPDTSVPTDIRYSQTLVFSLAASRSVSA